MNGDIMNELILIFIILIISGTIITTYHFYEKLGLKILFIIMTVLNLVMSFKTANLFGLIINLSLIPMTSIYTLTFILIEKHSKTEFKDNFKLIIKSILFIFPVFIVFLLFTQSINDNVTINENYLNEFLPNLISLIILPLFILLTVYIYNYLKQTNKNFYINVIICTILVSIIETFITTSIIYIKNTDIVLTMQIILTNYLFKILITLLNLGIIRLIATKRKWLE